jgi:carboxymethylenebutenolidase
VGEHGDRSLTAEDGNRFLASVARPARSAGRGMVILPDVRGLHPFYKDLAVRCAEAGFDTVAIDYFGRTARTETRDDSFEYRSHVERTQPETIARDVRAAVEHLRESGARSVFTVGFCFGGANSWRQSAEGHGLAGCIGFYGGHPMARVGSRVPDMRAPLLLLLAGDDSTPASEFEEFARRVRERGVEAEAHTYLGAPHSFFDRRFADYREACEDSWRRILEFTERHARAERPAPSSPAGARS